MGHLSAHDFPLRTYRFGLLHGTASLISFQRSRCTTAPELGRWPDVWPIEARSRFKQPFVNTPTTYGVR